MAFEAIFSCLCSNFVLLCFQIQLAVFLCLFVPVLLSLCSHTVSVYSNCSSLSFGLECLCISFESFSSNPPKFNHLAEHVYGGVCHRSL